MTATAFELAPSRVYPLPQRDLVPVGAHSAVRGGINSTEAHIGQYDECSEGVLLVLPNILKAKILVIGNMYRYVHEVPFSEGNASVVSGGADFWHILRETKAHRLNIFRILILYLSSLSLKGMRSFFMVFFVILNFTLAPAKWRSKGRLEIYWVYWVRYSHIQK